MKNKALLLFFFLFPFSLNLQAAIQELPAGKDMMWAQPPANPNLFWGSGGEAQKPVGPFTFVEEDTKGANPKVWVTDKNGVRWGVKFGDEAQSETAASRFFWAVGYRTSYVYLVPEGTIQGTKNLSSRVAKEIDPATGQFKKARFQKHNIGPDVAKVEDHYIPWDWDKNPFVGTKELSGLLLMNVLLANFDTREANNKVETVIYKNGQVENWYMTSDIGGTFGKSERVGHSKWNLKDYAKEPFLEGVKGDKLMMLHGGAKHNHFRSIPLEHARWISALLATLTRAQIEDAFRAAFSDVPQSPLPNAEDEATVKGFADAFQKYLKELQQAVR